MTAMFIVCIGISTIFHTAELGLLNKEYECYARLQISYKLKRITVVTAIGTALAMVLHKMNPLTSRVF